MLSCIEKVLQFNINNNNNNNSLFLQYEMLYKYQKIMSTIIFILFFIII